MEKSRMVEITTIVGAIVLFAVITVSSWAVLTELEEDRPADITVKVVAQQFAWQFIYPDGTVDAVLRVKAGQTVRLEMTSRDVIHSFYINDFGVKKDVVPGRTNVLYITPLVPGKYLIQCAEFCGEGHYSMFTWLEVTP